MLISNQIGADKMAHKIPQQRMRAKQIALEFGIGLSTVWHYSKLGLLTPIKITNGLTVFSRKEVEALFKCEEVAL